MAMQCSRFNPVSLGSRLQRTAGLAATLCALALAGCSALPQPPVQQMRYDFGPLAAVQPAPAAQLPALVLSEVQAPGLPEGLSAMYYRLGYANGQELRAYQNARWSQPPAQLVQQRLRAVLGAQRPLLGSLDNTVLPSPQGLPAAVLRVELEEFSQLFDAPQSSKGVVRLRASLIGADRSAGNLLLGQQVFAAQAPSASADAAGGARALAAATDDALAQLDRWLLGQGH